MILKQGFYLDELIIQNIATFEIERINFTSNFNCIVGETGSGKSLILDCLQMVFGARADKNIIRKNTDFATIEAVFKTSDDIIKNYFSEIGYPFSGNEIIVKRVIQKNGGSKAYLNHQSCSIQTLTSFAKKFIDLVGQFENQKLLSEGYQLKLLDQYAGLENEFSEYQHTFQEYAHQLRELEELEKGSSEKAQRLDYLQFQVEELSKLSPTKEDEQELIKRKDELQNIISEQQSFAQINHILIDSERDNVLSALKNTGELIRNLSISNANEMYEQILTAINIVEDVSYDISKLSGDIDDEEFNNIIDRLDAYQKAKRKFSTDIDGLIEVMSDFQEEIQSYSDAESKIKQLKEQIAANKKLLNQIALKLHDERVKSGKKLQKELSQKIQDLRMKGASIKFDFEKLEGLSATGLSRLNFLAETNPGEGFSLVKKTASGGELSRILLSYRQVLSSKDSISIFLFDEIDTGVGGETAKKIGQALQDVSNNGQVIAITHLPQIATLADNLVVVDKLVDSKENRTKTSVQILSGTKKESVISQMATVH